MTWEIVLGIIALAGFLLSVIAPILRLNANITKLNCAIDALYESTRRTDKRLDDLAEKSEDHEKRMIRIEQQTKALNNAVFGRKD